MGVEGGRERGRGGSEGWDGVRESGERGGREGERRMEGREGGRERGREGGNNCGVVLVVNIYYKLWKERHRTHHYNGQRLDDAQLVHKSSTSVQ